MPKKFSPELRERAVREVRMVYERQAREGSARYPSAPSLSNSA